MIITNQNKGTYHKESMRTGRKKRRLPEARENAVLVFESDWLKERREFFRPITLRSKAKPKQS